MKEITHASKNDIPIAFSNEQMEVRTIEADDYVVSFTTVKVDWEPPSLLFKGLPGDMCQTPHYGYVFKGQIVLKYMDHEETIKAGEAYYMKPGHIPIRGVKGLEFLEISPKAEQERTMSVIMKNMEALQAQKPT
ncbi:MAG: cupin domain-containing protein [Candidatus Bathyarchaeota archaeon]|nr:cupin domain-containing protein [Candidatus Bathyarchaeota archaeon]